MASHRAPAPTNWVEGDQVVSVPVLDVFTGPYFFLSNFAESPMEFEGPSMAPRNERYLSRPIAVVDSDPSWAASFRAERRLILAAVGQAVVEPTAPMRGGVGMTESGLHPDL